MSRLEQDIEKTLNTTDRMNRVSPSGDLMQRLKSIPTNVTEVYATVPKKVIWAAAASIALLIAMNFISLKNYATEQSTSEQPSESSSYFDYLNSL